MKAIETKHLTKFYGKARGITDVTLSVTEGDFFGFIGPNGAGKSTTIRTLLGLISPTSGSATVLGNNILQNRMEILSQVGYLPSEAMFYNGMRVRDILSPQNCTKPIAEKRPEGQATVRRGTPLAVWRNCLSETAKRSALSVHFSTNRSCIF